MRTLLIDLSRACASFFVYKHSRDALDGVGDADCFVARDEFPRATVQLTESVRREGAQLWEYPYQPWATTYFVLPPVGDFRPNLLAEVDLNTAPTVALTQWLREPAARDLCEYGGVRVAGPALEGVASLLFWHLSMPANHIPEREVRALASLDDGAWSALERILSSQVPFPSNRFLIAFARRRRRLACDRASVSSDSRRFGPSCIRGLLFMNGLLSAPTHAMRGLRWRLSGRHRRMRAFGSVFVHQARRSIERLGSYEEFASAVRNAGGRRIL